MNIIKKVAIIIPALLLFILAALILTPVLFKGKIIAVAKTEINNMLAARVDFADLNLSFIRDFPNASIALEDVSVTGTGAFEGETLAAFKTFSVTVDIMSVIKRENMQVKSILLDRPVANAHIREDGTANWNIMKASGEGGSPDQNPPITDSSEKTESGVPPPLDGGTPPQDGGAISIALHKFEIRHAALSFTNDQNNMQASIGDLNLSLRGDTTLDTADVTLKLDMDGLNFIMDGARLAHNARSGLALVAAGDFKNMAFTLKEARFNLNEIILNLSGSARIGDDIELDVSFATEKTDFKDVLSMIPAIYMKDFEKVTTTGSFGVSGAIQGVMNSERMPNARVNLTVENAMFKYPDLPKSVNNINIAVRAFYDGAVFDNTTADIDRFHFEMAGNPFDAELHVKTPESDMQVAAKFNGKIDFNSLRDIIPLDDLTLRGLLECDLALAGRLSTIEQERYEDFDARGSVTLTGVNLAMPALPAAVNIASTQLDFTPRRVNLARFNATMGNSDVALNGALENFIPFVFKGSTVRGNLSLRSQKIDLNEFIGGENHEKPAETAKTEKENEPMTVIEVPKNIDFALNVNIGTLLFDKLAITNTMGAVQIKDGALNMQRLAMNLLEGSMTLNGEYDTRNINVPSINFGMDIRRFDVTSAISSFDILKKILPQPQNYAGQVSANLTLTGVLDAAMSPILDSVVSSGQVQTHNLKVVNNEIFGKMADLLKNEMWRTPSLNNVNIKFEIHDGRVFVEPFPINIAQTRFELAGSQGLDMTMDYTINAMVPMSAVGKGANDVLGKIPGGANIREIRVTGLVGGTVEKPEVSLNVADMAAGAAQAVATAVAQQATQRVSAEIERQRAAIMAEADKQAQTIRATAKQSADRIRSEANSAANRVEREATNPLQKTAAKVAAGKIRSEGESNATRVEREADRQITNVMDAARKRAEAIK